MECLQPLLVLTHRVVFFPPLELVLGEGRGNLAVELFQQAEKQTKK